MAPGGFGQSTHVPPAPAWPRSPLPLGTAARSHHHRSGHNGRTYSQAHGGRGGTVRSRRSTAKHRRVPPWGRGDAGGAEGVPRPGVSAEVRSGLMSSKASGRSPTSQLVLRSQPSAGGPAAPRSGGATPRGQSLNYRLLLDRPGCSSRDVSSSRPGAALMGPSATSEFSRAIGSTGERAPTASRPPQLHTGQRGESGGPHTPRPGRR